MDPHLVKPGSWDNIRIILNDISWGYSVMYGKFNGTYCLGIRWNGNGNDRGYPGQGPYPLWFVLPDPFAIVILNQLSVMSASNPNINQSVLQEAIDKLT